MIVDDLAFSDIDAAEETANELLRRGIKKRFFAQVRADNVWPRSAEKRKRHQAVFAKLVQAGLDLVLLGLESFDPAGLKRVNKGSTVEQNIRAIEFLRSIGAKLWGAQIIFPGWDLEDFDKTIELNCQLGIEIPQFTILTPLPGTPDYQRAKAEGTLLTEEPAMFDFFHSVMKTKLPLPQFYTEIARLYRETGTLGVTDKGALAAQSATASMTRTIFRDIRDGLTDAAALQAFKQRCDLLRNDEAHLARLAQSVLHQVGADGIVDQLGELEALSEVENQPHPDSQTWTGVQEAAGEPDEGWAERLQQVAAELAAKYRRPSVQVSTPSTSPIVA